MNATVQWLAGLCQEHLLAEKWLLAEDLRSAQQWKDRLNLAGHSTIHLHAQSVPSLTVTLSGNLLADQGLRYVSSATSQMIVRGVLSQLIAEGQLSYFASSHGLDSLSELLSHSIHDMRLANLRPESLGESEFESAAKGRDIKRIFRGYCQELERRRLVDYPGALQRVTEGLEAGLIDLSRPLMMIPEELQLSSLESGMLEAFAKRASIMRPPGIEVFSPRATRNRIASRVKAGSAQFEYFCGYGEVNEVRGVLQRVLSKATEGPIAFDDVEILHTDYSHYVPLIYELLAKWLTEPASKGDGVGGQLASLESLPVTFAEGLACIYSRPGRALRGWLRWARHDFIQSKLVQLIREGLLVRPEPANTIGYSRLANTLRRLPIGFQADRYLPKIRAAILSARNRIEEQASRLPKNATRRQTHEPQRDFGLAALEALEAMVNRLVELAPRPSDDAVALLEKTRLFLTDCARADNQLDRYAKAKLLDDISGMQATLQYVDQADFGVWQWLEELPQQSRILSGGPMPGCMHLAPLSTGGTSGRRQLFVIGLDDGRFPKQARVEPVLLDSERRRISADLPTSHQVAERQQQALMRMLYRALADDELKVYCSYSCRTLGEDRTLFPSSSLLELFRLTENKPDAHMQDLLRGIGPPVSFVSLNPHHHLDDGDVSLALQLGEPEVAKRQRLLQRDFPHHAFQQRAREALFSAELSSFDGYVPEAGQDLDPSTNGRRISASHLETYGVCPRRYFFRHGLRITPPDEWQMDPEKWLDALQFGSFVHSLFEEFLREHTKQQLRPCVKRDREPLRRQLHSKLKQWQLDLPILSQDAYQRQLEQLEEICDIFLRKEEEYCEGRNATPWVMEASIGLGDAPATPLDCPEPIPLSLSDGRVLQVGGKIDRVDRLMVEGSEHYAIWDYKSGSDYGFSQEDPFRHGRKLQPFLYLGMLRHRIISLGGKKEAVESFGFFFPTFKTDGLRLSWTHAELKRGDEILRLVCDSIRKGLFVPTTDKDDCKYCDYLAVCGDPAIVTADSLRKSQEPQNHSTMRSWRKLREIE
ncbi:MAG: PD-(D/E)XK nuclease family protein [bacterium]|nr:PD-(D/E)XK nuclease family protein [bacterium]